MSIPLTGPVLLVCASQQRADKILAELDLDGISAVGPAPTAGLALILTAQTGPRTAILAGPTAGRRSAAQLAEELTRTWGVECLILSEEPSDGARESSEPNSALQ